MNNPNRPPQGGYRQGGQTGSRGETAQAALPDINLQSDPQQFVKNAENWAKLWSRAGATKSQVRRFYGEVRRLQQLISPKGEDGWTEHELEFRMLKPKAAYARQAAGRAPRELTEFIQKGVDQVKGLKEFERFVQLFESVVGFAYSEGLGERN